MFSFVRSCIFSFFKGVANYLMPPSCLACRSLIWDRVNLCAKCWNRLNFIQELHCIRCGRLANFQGLECIFCIKEAPKYDVARSLVDFDSVSKRYIHDLKYSNRTDLIHFFARLASYHMKNFISDADLVIPVPMHFFKRMVRSYNQAHVLASSISKITCKDFSPFILRKFKFTATQTSKNREERKRNLKGSFSVRDKYKTLQGKTILLVDDVMTTGSTANVCAQLLKLHGALQVKVLTIASVR